MSNTFLQRVCSLLKKSIRAVTHAPIGCFQGPQKFSTLFEVLADFVGTLSERRTNGAQTVNVSGKSASINDPPLLRLKNVES